MRPIGIFGGAFDPVHYGHLRTALELLVKLALAEVRFMPTGVPPHRTAPIASAAVRCAMLEAAVAGQPGFRIDTRELERAGPSYSVDTLASLRAEFPQRSLCLLLGMDAFLGLPRWHRWEEVLGLAHIVVAQRPGWQAPREGVLAEVLRARRAPQAETLAAATAGYIHFEAVTQLEISSSELRSALHAACGGRYLLPEAVRAIALSAGCYAQ
jgi:nicotinate-nucleotide adenylyltransferase